MNYKFLDEIKEKMHEVISESLQEDKIYAFTGYELNCGCIDITTNPCDMVEVEVYSDKKGRCDAKYPNIIAAIKEVVPTWEEVKEELQESMEDEWQRNGFANEQDYLRYRYG